MQEKKTVYGIDIENNTDFVELNLLKDKLNKNHSKNDNQFFILAPKKKSLLQALIGMATQQLASNRSVAKQKLLSGEIQLIEIPDFISEKKEVILVTFDEESKSLDHAPLSQLVSTTESFPT